MTDLSYDPVEFPKLIHDWFELSYCAYLTLPRSVLQSMPKGWQAKFVTLLDEVDDHVRAAGIEGYNTRVTAVDESGKFVKDPLRDYQRGRRNVFREVGYDPLHAPPVAP